MISLEIVCLTELWKKMECIRQIIKDDFELGSSYTRNVYTKRDGVRIRVKKTVEFSNIQIRQFCIDRILNSVVVLSNINTTVSIFWTFTDLQPVNICLDNLNDILDHIKLNNTHIYLWWFQFWFEKSNNDDLSIMFPKIKICKAT